VPLLDPAPRSWQQRYGLRLLVSDLIVLIWVVFGTQIFWFGTGNAQIALRQANAPDISYWAASALLVILWFAALSLSESRSHRIVGVGNTEYVRVVTASVRLFGWIAIFAFLFQIDLARGYLLISLPLGILALLLIRWLWRQWLVAKRGAGLCMTHVLLVGSEASVEEVCTRLQRRPLAGFLVVGACVSGGVRGETVSYTGVPILGDIDEIPQALATTRADTLVITGSDDLPPEKVKEISWSLEAGRQHLVLAPNIADITGPRMHTRPVAGLPLIHVETPRFSSGQLFTKRMTDLAVSLVAVIITSPLLIVLAILVRLSGPGPVIFRQTRIGLRGRSFTMLKFRSMVDGADDLIGKLESLEQDAGNRVLFKMKNDPRVTGVGRWMRRYSLDELPQLFNVLGGSMSLVGPRPPLPREVEQYADHVHRRFLMKPGITGLWQVSGRSTLTWEESVRIDLYYVENWSLAGDLAVLLKTAKAAIAPGESAH